MSSLSIPRPKKVSDVQFIGDLTKLFERRKIKCGNSESLEKFGIELSANYILRSDLFTLCTAISHMADEDLSGEQLLVLVARALGGPEVYNGDGSVTVPASMRSAFLAGYQAWGNRGSEINQPLPWPPPRPAAIRDEPPAATQASADVSDPAASKVPAPGMRTLQEALDLAWERSPIAMPVQRSPSVGSTIEGLTINELKTLLDDIEERMSRLQPHLRELSSIVRSPVEEVRRREPGQPSEEARSAKTAVPTTESAVRLAAGRESPADGALSNPASEQSSGLGSTSAALSEAAFLARHPYLRPKQRVGADLVHTVSIFDPATTPVAAVPAAPAAAPILAAAAPVVAGPPAAFAAPIAAASLVPLVAPAPPEVVIMTEACGSVVDDSFYPYEVESNTLRITPRLVLAVIAALLVVPVGFAGVLVYRYFHSSYIIYTDPKPSTLNQAPEFPADPLAGVGPATPDTTAEAASSTRPESRQQPPIAHNGTKREDAARQARMGSQQPASSIWPPPPVNAAGGETPSPTRPLTASAASTSSAPHTAASAGPHYVPSSTMIQYAISAPKPIYPVDKANGADGTVVLQITISRQGVVTSTRTVSGPAGLRSAAVQAVRAWRFRPYLIDGNPAEVVTTLELPFKRP